MISIILIFFASICHAITNSLNHNFDNSIFRNLDPTVWNPNNPVHKYKFDVYNILKTAEVILIFLGVICYKSITDNTPLDVFAYGAVWYVVDELMTDEILNIKKNA